MQLFNFFDQFWQFFSHDLGIDLGTSNTLVYVLGKGIVVREPSVVARHKKTKEILAIGSPAKKMIGKTPATIEVVKPLENGVIADFDACEAMIKKYLKLVHQSDRLIPMIAKPKVIIAIPSGVTEVERRAVQDLALSAGARKAYLIESPMASAVGLGLPIEKPEGMLVVNIGSGTTEVAVISLGGIVVSRSLRIAGNEMDKAIISYIRLKHSLLLGQATSEDIKIQIGSAAPSKKEKHIIVRGRDLEKGLPKSVKLSSNEVREAISPVIRRIIDSLSSVLEETPPELTSDIVKKGVNLCGGGSLLYGIDTIIAEETKIPVWRAEKPKDTVVLGCAKVLENPLLLQKVRVTGGLR